MHNVAMILLIVCLTLSILCLLFGKIYVVNNYEIKLDCPAKLKQPLASPAPESLASEEPGYRETTN